MVAAVLQRSASLDRLTVMLLVVCDPYYSASSKFLDVSIVSWSSAFTWREVSGISQSKQQKEKKNVEELRTLTDAFHNIFVTTLSDVIDQVDCLE